MTNAAILSPTEGARPLCVRTAVVIEAMYEEQLPRVRLDDGTAHGGSTPRRAVTGPEGPATMPDTH